MEYEVEYTDELEAWWDGLDAEEQDSVRAGVEKLIKFGPILEHPYSSAIHGSRHGHMRELRVQHRGRPYRVLYAFDPRRVGILLIGGEKTGRRRWYRQFIPIADDLYDQHLREIATEEGWRGAAEWT
jgi:hypothetical protein